MNFAPFIDGSYGVTVIFLIAIAATTFARYRRATKHLAQAEQVRRAQR